MAPSLTDDLATLDPTDPDAFARMVRVSLPLFEDAQAMAQFLSVSPPTIERWKRGEVAPMGTMRLQVRDRLLARARGRITP